MPLRSSDAAKRRLVEVQVDLYRRERSKDAPDRPIATFLTPVERQTLQTGRREDKVQVLGALSGVELDEALLFMPRRAREQLYPAVNPELRRRIQMEFQRHRIEITTADDIDQPSIFDVREEAPGQRISGLSKSK